MWNKAILVLGPLLITGCGLTQVQKDSIGQFSRASASFSESVSIQLTDARSTVLELNTSVLSLRAKQDNSLDKVDGSFSLNESVLGSGPPKPFSHMHNYCWH